MIMWIKALVRPLRRNIRWWMIGLIMLGLDHQLPDAQHAGGRRADHAQGPAHHRRSSIRGSSARFQGAIMLQPVCGYVLDVLGLKIGFAIFAVAWSLINMAHALARQLAGVRRPARRCWDSPKARPIPPA